MRLNASLLLLSALLFAVSLFTGSAPLSIAETVRGLIGQGGPVTVIIWEIRAPRAVAAFGVGAALGLAGAALQGLLRNPLAGPGVLGVSAFSALGAVCVIYFGLVALGVWVVPLAAVSFAGLAMVLLLAASGKSPDTVRMILVGIGLSSLAGALTALAMNMAPNPFSLSDMVNWLLGTVTNRSWLDVGLVLPFWVIGGGVILMAGPGLRALSLGEETALTMGADPARTRLLVIAGTSLLAGASVAIAGTIGFVGIVAPHVVRPFARHDPQRLLIPSALAAGAMLMAADLVIRVLPFDQELRLGVAAALFGAPVFIWIASRLAGETR